MEYSNPVCLLEPQPHPSKTFPCLARTPGSSVKPPGQVPAQLTGPRASAAPWTHADPLTTLLVTLGFPDVPRHPLPLVCPLLNIYEARFYMCHGSPGPEDVSEATKAVILCPHTPCAPAVWPAWPLISSSLGWLTSSSWGDFKITFIYTCMLCVYLSA